MPPPAPPPPPAVALDPQNPLVFDDGVSPPGGMPPGMGGTPPGGTPPGGTPPGAGEPASTGEPGDGPAVASPFSRRRVTLPRSTRVWSRAIVWSLIAITTGGTVYGFTARIESSVAAPGRIRPIGGVVELAPPINGLVQQVLVKNGEQVRKGQPLLRLRDDSGPPILRNLERIQQLWMSEVRVLARQLNLGPLPDDPDGLAQLLADERELQLREQASQRELIRSRLQASQQLSDLQGMRSQLRTNQDITNRMRRLVQQGAMSRLELDRQLERQMQIATSLRRTEREWQSAQERVEETRLKTLQIPAAERRQVFTRFNNARQQLIEANSKISDQKQRLAFQLVRAPIAGKVTDLKARVGELASPNETAVRIVPNALMEARLNVSNRDIGFLRKGMKVDVRIDSFPSTEYGSLKGWITTISDDALPPDENSQTEYFSVTVKLDKQQLERRGVNYSLRPGMSLSGLIILDTRPAISLITDRFSRFFEASRTIR